MLVDMHLHECTYSTDSFLHLEEIVSIARQKGLDAICITDHDSMGLRERAEAASGVHGTNERLLVRSYLQGIRVLIDLMEHANVEP